MAIQATGQVVRDRRGLDLMLERRIPAPVSSVWPWFTTATKAKRWLGAVEFTETDTLSRLRFDDVTVSFAEVDGATMLYFDQRIESAIQAGEVGPHWEYALDCLTALVSGAPLPDRSEYIPSQQPHYERLAMDGDPVGWPPS